MITVLVKRTYRLERGGGPLSPLPESLPLVREPIVEGDAAGELLVEATDCWPIKLGTDVVVLGAVHAPHGRPTTETMASVTVAGYSKHVKVTGNRLIEKQAGGGWRFSAPEPFEVMPLSFRRAYGGLDRSLPWPDEASIDSIPDETSFDEYCERVLQLIPRVYPRNPVGCGYLVYASTGRIAGTSLPNFEDPERTLRPEQLFAGRPEDWWQMPTPQGFGWYDRTWYPRCLYFGILPEFPAPDESDAVEEVSRGYLPRGQTQRTAATDVPHLFDLRLANGAAPGLILPRLAGNERVSAHGFSPAGPLEFALPGRPSVEIRHQGAELPPELSLHTVSIEPDESRVSLTWGARVAPPPLLANFVGPEAALFDPATGVEIIVDGHAYRHDAEGQAAPS